MTRILTSDEVAAKNALAKAAWGRPTKHRSVETIIDGEKFDSKLESRVWQSLKLREKAGEISGLRRQVKFSLFVNHGEHYGTYTADFVYYDRDHDYVVADAKSPHTRKLAAWQKVKLLMLNCHGHNIVELP